MNLPSNLIRLIEECNKNIKTTDILFDLDIPTIDVILNNPHHFFIIENLLVNKILRNLSDSNDLDLQNIAKNFQVQ